MGHYFLTGGSEMLGVLIVRALAMRAEHLCHMILWKKMSEGEETGSALVCTAPTEDR